MQLGLALLVRGAGVMPVAPWKGGRVGASGMAIWSLQHASEFPMSILKIELLSPKQFLRLLGGLDPRKLDEVT